MNFFIRPSKCFLYDLLESELAGLCGEVGLDAASADFKNRRMFHTRRYYGVDQDLALLRAGLLKYQDQNTFGLLADMARLEALPDCSVDAVVSTKTLYQIDREDRMRAIAHLCRICRPDGELICELRLDGDFDESLKIIRSYFENVKVIYYRNLVSRFYESVFERDGDLGSHPIAGLRPFRLFSWLLSRLEFLSMRSRGLNRNAVVIGKNKKGAIGAQKFDLSRLARKEERLYEIV